MVSDRIVLALAVALISAAAIACAQSSARANYKVIDPPPGPQPSKPEYRVNQSNGATVVSIHIGEKSTGGFDVVVTKVDRSGDTCTVRYKVEAPSRDAMVAQVITYPATAVRISPACKNVKVDPPIPQRQQVDR